MDTLLDLLKRTDAPAVWMHPETLREIYRWMIEQQRCVGVGALDSGDAAIYFKGTALIYSTRVPKDSICLSDPLGLVPDTDNVEWTPYDTLDL